MMYDFGLKCYEQIRNYTPHLLLTYSFRIFENPSWPCDTVYNSVYPLALKYLAVNELDETLYFP